MAHVFTNDKGKKVVLKNPAEKGKSYARDLKRKVNSETGEVLRDTQLAFRSGYLKAREDSAKAYNYNNGKPNKKKTIQNKNSRRRDKRKAYIV